MAGKHLYADDTGGAAHHGCGAALMQEAAANPGGPMIAKCRLARALAMVMIGLTAAVALTWSHAKMFSQDEMYEFQTDSLRSLAELVHVQKTWPISLDPLLYHTLSHGAMKVFGAGPFAQRLPALLGFLLMQACLFFFVRRAAGERAGALAAALPAVTATLYYGVEGRPYGLLLGLYAVTLLCWQAATRAGEVTVQGTANGVRWLGLAGMAVGIAAAINAHYFGILLLGPVCAAEAFRTMQRRRVDWAVLAAIALGMGGVLTTRPFMKAAGEFRVHYYNAGSVGLHDITRAYRSIFVDYTAMPKPVQDVLAAGLLILAAALMWGCVRVIREDKPRVPAAEWVLLLTLAGLPFGGYLLARFVTHSIEVRYVLGAVVAISALVAIALSRLLESDVIFAGVMLVAGLGIAGAGAVRIRAEQNKSAARMAALVLPARVKTALSNAPDGRLYVQDMGAFEEDRYYEPDADVKSRMTLVYSPAQELRWNGHDTMALTAAHLQHFTDLPVTSYQELRARPGEHLFVLFHTGWDWTDQAFAADGAEVQPVGPALGGDAAAVRFR